MRYVALLRGINVGGKNLIGMPALKACLEEAGYAGVRTYIQSGNVLFDAPKAKRDILARKIEDAIEKTFALPIVVVLRSAGEMNAVVADRPTGFGDDPSGFRYDVVFLKEPLTPRAALESVPVREDVDRVWPGRGVIYFSRVAAKLSQSRMNRIVGTPNYKLMTIRNWNTTRKLRDLLTAT